MNLPRYSSLKQSSAAWIGHIPSHWAEVSLKRGLRLITSKTSDDALPKVALENIESRTGRYVETETQYEGDGTAFHRGDILFGKLRPYLAKALLANMPGQAVGDFHVLRPISELDGRFALYYLLSQHFIAVVDGSTYGAKMPRVSWDFMASLPLPLPPMPEQTAIAAFLDRETGKIDALVEKQKRLIELLKEKRQAVISHAVTKGLDPNASMKPSGVEWLGDVPEHWEVRPLKYLVDFESGGTPSKANPEYWDGDVPWVSAKDLKRDVLSDTQDHITDTALAEGAASLVPTGTVVVLVRGMMLARAFPVVRLAAPMAINQDLKALVCSLLRMEYLAWALRGLERECLSRIDEAGHGTKALRMEAWTSMEFPQPPDEEQERIAKHLDTATKSLDELVSAANAAIELLQERRSALVSAAVTGKIDVRKLDQNKGEAA